MTYRENISPQIEAMGGERPCFCVVYELSPEGSVCTYYGIVTDDQKAGIRALLGEPYGQALLSPESMDQAAQAPFVMLETERSGT